MTITTTTPFLDAVLTAIPKQYAPDTKDAPISRHTLDAIVRFSAGADCPPDASDESRSQWAVKQATAFEHLLSDTTRKRVAGDDGQSGDSSKRVKVSNSEKEGEDAGPLLSCICSISVVSPIRKKVDLEIHSNAILLVHPTTRICEALPLKVGDVTRILVLPTRGKAAGHWTVTILCENVLPDTTYSKAKEQMQQQIVFGLDAKPSTSLSYQKPGHPERCTLSKGSDVLPILRAVLAALTSPILEMDTSPDAHCHSVDAFKGAKPGGLYFTSHGVVSVFGKPNGVEYWAFEDIVGGDVGVRILSATGRNCSVFVARKIHGVDDDDGEANFAECGWEMIDGKEQEKIRIWIAAYQHRFNVPVVMPSRARVGPAGNDTSTVSSDAPIYSKHVSHIDDSDASDDSFTVDSDDDDGGSATSDSTASDLDNENADTDEEEEEEEEEGDAVDAPLDPKHHPLLRPGAMPKRVSRAFVDEVVAMVEEDLMGGEAWHRQEVESEDDELDE